jgi:hypothetical protein
VTTSGDTSTAWGPTCNWQFHQWRENDASPTFPFPPLRYLHNALFKSSPRMNRFVTRCTIAVLALAVCTTAGRAQTSGTVAYVRDDFDVRCYFTAATADPDCVTDANGFTASTSTRFGGSVSYTARAEATIGGPLKAQVTATVSDVPLDPRTVQEISASTDPRYGIRGYVVLARAEYYDQVFISGLTAPASIRFFMNIDGTAGQTNLDPRRASGGEFRAGRYVSAPVNGTAFGVPTVLFAPTRFAPTDGTPLVTFFDIPVVAGMNYLLFSLAAAAYVGPAAGTIPGQPWSGTAFADYFSTANITGTAIVNAQGETISNVNASFAGAQNLNVVPEPSTYALMAFGLAALGVAARRRRRS